jgi:hypothetical protein
MTKEGMNKSGEREWERSEARRCTGSVAEMRE